jgi:hypothetical protein
MTTSLSIPHKGSLIPRAIAKLAFKHDECWWLITSIVIRGYPDRRYLAVFFAGSLLAGEWQPHPINNQMLYNDPRLWLRSQCRRSHSFRRAIAAALAAQSKILWRSC